MSWTREAEQDMILAILGYKSIDDAKNKKASWEGVHEHMQAWGYTMSKDAMVSRWSKYILKGFKDRRTNGPNGAIQPPTPTARRPRAGATPKSGGGRARGNKATSGRGNKRTHDDLDSTEQEELEENNDDDDEEEEKLATSNKRARRATPKRTAKLAPKSYAESEVETEAEGRDSAGELDADDEDQVGAADASDDGDRSDDETQQFVKREHEEGSEQSI